MRLTWKQDGCLRKHIRKEMYGSQSRIYMETNVQVAIPQWDMEVVQLQRLTSQESLGRSLKVRLGVLDMRPDISEFSYGFAITMEIAQGARSLAAAPVFPSLRAEGQHGDGWDVKRDLPGVPLFLQFKLCEKMTRSTCREARDAGFNLPCYRMRLLPARLSRQHEMLMDLQATGQQVYYCAPEFHRVEEFNDAFLRRAVCERSVCVRPSDIGPLPDDGDHHLSFEPRSPWATLFSEPRPIEAKRKFEDVAAELKHRLNERARTHFSDELESLEERLAHVVGEKSDTGQRMVDFSGEAPAPSELLRRIAYYSSVLLEAQFFVVQER